MARLASAQLVFQGKQTKPSKQPTKTSFFFLCGEEENREIHTAGFKEKHGQTEAGDAGTWGGEQTGRMHMCRKERGGRKGRKALKKIYEKEKKSSERGLKHCRPCFWGCRLHQTRKVSHSAIKGDTAPCMAYIPADRYGSAQRAPNLSVLFMWLCTARHFPDSSPKLPITHELRLLKTLRLPL